MESLAMAHRAVLSVVFNSERLFSCHATARPPTLQGRGRSPCAVPQVGGMKKMLKQLGAHLHQTQAGSFQPPAGPCLIYKPIPQGSPGRAWGCYSHTKIHLSPPLRSHPSQHHCRLLPALPMQVSQQRCGTPSRGGTSLFPVGELGHDWAWSGIGSAERSRQMAEAALGGEEPSP